MGEKKNTEKNCNKFNTHAKYELLIDWNFLFLHLPNFCFKLKYR